MSTNSQVLFESSVPNPEFLIKSIAEQGYSLETSLADLIDNSISASADKIEILIDIDNEPFTLFMADNGAGMDEISLRENMKFPSTSPDSLRNTNDMGRFGLGMKTASFSQTRCLTVISRKKGTLKYTARTWDVEHLKNKGWEIKINSAHEIEGLLRKYNELSNCHLQQFPSYEPNTIIVWNGLFKFEQYIDKSNRHLALKQEISEITSSYLSLVFHRFMQVEFPMQIRVNNNIIKPFNPFPVAEKGFRPIAYKEKGISNDSIKIQGFVLPSRSIAESNNSINVWTPKNKGLMDMEGIYIYRSNRIILFGKWLGIIKKGPRLQLARLRVDVGNSVDHLLHLNVAKSQVVIPHELLKAFELYVDQLKIEAEREFYNRGVRTYSSNSKDIKIQLFERKASNKGILLEFNKNFPLLKSLTSELELKQISKLNLLLRMISMRINEIRQTHEDKIFVGIEEDDGLSIKDLMTCIKQLKQNGFSNDHIKEEIIANLGFKENTLPSEIVNLLK